MNNGARRIYSVHTIHQSTHVTHNCASFAVEKDKAESSTKPHQFDSRQKDLSNELKHTFNAIHYHSYSYYALLLLKWTLNIFVHVVVIARQACQLHRYLFVSLFILFQLNFRKNTRCTYSCECRNHWSTTCISKKRRIINIKWILFVVCVHTFTWFSGYYYYYYCYLACKSDDNHLNEEREK